MSLKIALDILQPQGIDESNIADYTGKEAVASNWEPYASDLDGGTDEGQQFGALLMEEAVNALTKAADQANDR